MKERPILFSGPMVRAILAGQKTQTRRVIKPQPVRFINPTWPTHGWREVPHMGGWEVTWHQDSLTPTQAIGEYCPYGAPRDLLWVRETHVVTAGGNVLYKADNPDLTNCRPSIFMTRQHSRITLEVVSVRVERLQEITEEDAIAEGVEMGIWDQAIVARDYSSGDDWFQSWTDDAPGYVHENCLARSSYRTLWDRINEKRGYGWQANPWVWAVEFRAVKA